MSKQELKNPYVLAWLLTFIATFVWSAISPYERLTWFLEVLPAIIGLALIVLTYNSFRLSPLLYFLILIHAIILMVGGHYTYAKVPLFDTLAEIFSWQRNNYDKVGHFAQGFVPAILAREILLRKNAINGRAWLNFVVVSICLAFSAFYEILEWWAAISLGDSAESFLGTQGYSWDTQSDMALALLGAISALVLLAKMHDRQLLKVGKLSESS